MTARQILERLALQRAYPDCYVPCRSCAREGDQCPHCLGTRKVTVATSRAEAEGRRLTECA